MMIASRVTNYIKSISPGSADSLTAVTVSLTVISLSECESSPNYESWQIMCRIFKLAIDTEPILNYEY